MNGLPEYLRPFSGLASINGFRFPAFDWEPCTQSRFPGIGLFKLLFTMKLVPLGHGRVPKDNNGPLLVEVVPQLSVEQIFRDYCRGVLHPSLPGGLYDPDEIDDDNMQDVDEVEDISELYNADFPLPKQSIKEDPKEDLKEDPKEDPKES